MRSARLLTLFRPCRLFGPIRVVIIVIILRRSTWTRPKSTTMTAEYCEYRALYYYYYMLIFFGWVYYCIVFRYQTSFESMVFFSGGSNEHFPNRSAKETGAFSFKMKYRVIRKWMSNKIFVCPISMELLINYY